FHVTGVQTCALPISEPAVAVEVGGVVALVKALAHLRFALRTLAFVPGADLAAHQVAVAVAIDRFEMLEQRAAAPAARLPARLHFGPAQAAVAVGVQARMVAAVAMRVPAAVADHAAMALAVAPAVAVLRTLAGV